MKTAERIALIFGASYLGAGLVALYRGKQGKELLIDTALHGTIAGTALNVVGYMVLGSGEQVPVYALQNGLSSEDFEFDEEVEEEEEEARENPVSAAAENKASGTMGKTPKAAMDLLRDIDSKKLFSNLKENGVKIGEVPANASIIMQDES